MNSAEDSNSRPKQFFPEDSLTLVQSLAAAVYACDTEGRITLFNDAAIALWGRVPDVETEKWCGAFRVRRPNGTPLPWNVCPMALAVREGQAVFGEEVIVERPDGTRRNVLVYLRPIRNSSGAIVGAVNMVLDVTEYKTVQHALREIQERFQRYFELGLIGMAILSPAKEILEVNDELCRILSYQRHELLQMTWAALTHPDDLAASVRDFDRAIAGEIDAYSTDQKWIRKDGEVIHITISVKCLRNSDGAVQYFVALLQDVTARRRAEQERERLRNQLVQAQKMDWLGRLSGGVAHNFNNILGAVLAQAELALDELGAGSRPEEQLQRIRSLAFQGAQTARQLMVFAGAETETLELVEVSQAIKEMADLLKVSASKHVALELHLATHLPPVYANVEQLRRIVMNLVTNASEAIGDRQGVIRVATACVTARQVAAIACASPAHNGDYVQLEVTDTGHGIPRDVQAMVFDPFFSTRSTGRGLGLAVVRGIVRSLRGEIHLVSEPGNGTTFQILLPSAQPGAEATAGPILSAEEAERSKKEVTVLFVEDEDTLRQPIAKMLRKSGLEVLEAGDGSAAIDLLRSRNGDIDVVLLDLTIPGASSQEVVDQAAQTRSDIKVILTSAHSQETANALMGTRVVKGFIRKPFQVIELVQTIRTVLSS
jgi:PAS domain S-box-containing protein